MIAVGFVKGVLYYSTVIKSLSHTKFQTACFVLRNMDQCYNFKLKNGFITSVSTGIMKSGLKKVMSTWKCSLETKIYQDMISIVKYAKFKKVVVLTAIMIIAMFGFM